MVRLMSSIGHNARNSRCMCLGSVTDALESRGSAWLSAASNKTTNLKFYIADWLARKAAFAIILFLHEPCILRLYGVCLDLRNA